MKIEDVAELAGRELVKFSDGEGWEHHTVDGVYFKQIFLPEANLVVPQHAHAHDHATLVAAGAIKVWINGTLLHERVSAPASIHVAAGRKHTFLSLERGTVLYCVHNLHGLGEVEVAERHELKG